MQATTTTATTYSSKNPLRNYQDQSAAQDSHTASAPLHTCWSTQLSAMVWPWQETPWTRAPDPKKVILWPDQRKHGALRLNWCSHSWIPSCIHWIECRVKAIWKKKQCQKLFVTEVEASCLSNPHPGGFSQRPENAGSQSRRTDEFLSQEAGSMILHVCDLHISSTSLLLWSAI